MTVVCVFLLVHVYLLLIPGQILITRFIFLKYKNGDNTTHTIIVMIKWGKSEEWLVYNRPSHLLPEGKVQSILQLKSSNLLKQFYFFGKYYLSQAGCIFKYGFQRCGIEVRNGNGRPPN